MEQLMSAEGATNINSMPLLIPTLSTIFKLTLYSKLINLRWWNEITIANKSQRSHGEKDYDMRRC